LLQDAVTDFEGAGVPEGDVIRLTGESYAFAGNLGIDPKKGAVLPGAGDLPAPWNQLLMERGIANESERTAIGITARSGRRLGLIRCCRPTRLPSPALL
jgi:hypothetical protein